MKPTAIKITAGALFCAALMLASSRPDAGAAPAPALTATPTVVPVTCEPAQFPDPSLTPIPGPEPRAWLPLVERSC